MAPFSIISTTASFPFTLSVLNRANDAAEKYKGDFNAICSYVKDKLDSEVAPAWHCVIGWKLISNVRFWKKKCIILGNNDGKQQFLIFQAPPPQLVYPSKDIDYNQLDESEDENNESNQKKNDRKLVNIETNHVEMSEVLEKFTHKKVKEIFKSNEINDLTELTSKIKDELTSVNGSTWHVIATESHVDHDFGFSIDSHYENIRTEDSERCEIDLTVSFTKLRHGSVNNKKEQADRKVRLLIWKFEQKSFPILEFLSLQHISALFLILGAVTFIFQFQKKYFQCGKCCTIIGRYAQQSTLQNESSMVNKKSLQELLNDRGCFATDNSETYQCSDNEIQTALQCDDLCKWLMYASLFLIGVASCLKVIARWQKKQEKIQKKNRDIPVPKELNQTNKKQQNQKKKKNIKKT